MVRFAHVSDTHLGYRQYNLGEREVDFYESFHETIDKILEERVDFVIHSGDLFEHKRPRVEALLEAQKGFLKLKEKDIPIYCVAGNHDLTLRRGAVPPQRLFVEQGVRILGSKEKSIERKNDDLFIGGLSYFPRYYSEQLKDELNKLSEKAVNYKNRILILHQGLDAHLPYEGAYEIRLTELPKNFHYYAMGHVHRRIKEKYGEGILCFPGSTDVWRFDEVEDFKNKSKGFNLVSVENDEITIEDINLESTRYFDEYLIDTKDFDTVIEKIKGKLSPFSQNNLKLPILRIKIQGEMKFDNTYYANQIKQAIEQFVLFYKIDITPEEIQTEAEEMKTLNLHEILNEIYSSNTQLVDFTYSLFNQLQDRNLQGAKEIAEDFFEREVER